MMHTLLGTKMGQTQTFTDEGMRVPVTQIHAGPCWVTRIAKMNGYHMIQLAFGTAKTIAKPQAGTLKKAGLEGKKPRFFRDVKVTDFPEDLTVGSEITVADVFQVGDEIRVTGTSKGKGFAGVVKRHGFGGGPRTHGQSDRERAPGSIGSSATPGRVFKGKRMAGRMGDARVVQEGLVVVDIDSEHNMLTVKGLVPGGKNGLLMIQREDTSLRMPEKEEEDRKQEATPASEESPKTSDNEQKPDTQEKEAAVDTPKDTPQEVQKEQPAEESKEENADTQEEKEGVKKE